MVTDMKGKVKMDKKKGKEYIIIIILTDMKVNIKKDKKMDKEYIIIIMVKI
jgi:hypothetical protein